MALAYDERQQIVCYFVFHSSFASDCDLFFTLVSLAGAFIETVRLLWRPLLVARHAVCLTHIAHTHTHIYIESAFGFFASSSFYFMRGTSFFFFSIQTTHFYGWKKCARHERKSKENWRKEFLSFFFSLLFFCCRNCLLKSFTEPMMANKYQSTPHTGSGTQHTHWVKGTSKSTRTN